MKVLYPGPQVEASVGNGPITLGASGVTLIVGENDITDELAAVLLRSGTVIIPGFAEPPPIVADSKPAKRSRKRSTS